MGRNDQDAARPHRQLHKEPLELHYEKEEHRTHGHPLRYPSRHPDLILKKKNSFLAKNEVPDHYVRVERDLLALIYDNKENVIKIKDKNIDRKPAEFSHQDKKKLTFHQEMEKNMTVAQNRTKEHQQFHSKTTEKYVESENRLMPFSSLKKSERSMAIRENLGSLIFETPPKGRSQHNFYKFDSSRFFMDKIEISPTPWKMEEAEKAEEIVYVLSPSKFMIENDKKS